MRRSAWALALLVGALSLSACSDEPDPQEVVVGAADATIDAGSAEVLGSVAIKGPNEVRTSLEGRYDFGRRRGALTTTVQDREVRSVLAGSVFYEKVPGLADQIGTDWLSVDVVELDDELTIEESTMALDAVTGDPGTMLAYLRGAHDVRERGSAKVRGTSTTRYHALLDLEAAADAAPAKQREVVLRAAHLLGVDDQPVDVWIDGDGRVRRMVATFDYSEMALPDDLDREQLADAATLTLDLLDFGREVEVDVPDDEDVTDVSDLDDEAPPVTPTPEHVVLERSLLTDVPAGFEQQADDVGDTGPSDLAKAVRDDGGDDAEQVLRDAGFVAGYQRLWVKGDDDSEIVVFLYEFETPGGAATYTQRFRAEEDGGTDVGVRRRTFDVPTVPGARGTELVSDAGERAVSVDFVTGAFAVQVSMNGPSASSDLAVALARQQLQALTR